MDEKFVIASDIHGSAFWCKKLTQAFTKEGAKKLVLLGDLLYHGPRNPLPDGYAPMEVAATLNALKTQLLCVRGNCDGEVDQLVLEFPMRGDYALLCSGGKTLYLTHGHLAGEQNPPPLEAGEILVNGHTHDPKFSLLEGGVLYANCGSVSLPKAGTPHSYLLFTGDELIWKNLETGEEFNRVKL